MTSMGEMFPARMHTPLFPFRTALTTSFTPRFIAFFFAAFFTSCATPRPEPPRRQPPAGDDARGLAALGRNLRGACTRNAFQEKMRPF